MNITTIQSSLSNDINLFIRNGIDAQIYEALNNTNNFPELTDRHINSILRELNDSNVKYIESDTHLILVDTYRNKNDIIEDLENENYLLYKSNDEVGNYWTLPISMRRIINEKLTSVINYSL